MTRRSIASVLAAVLTVAPLAAGAVGAHPARTIVQTGDGPPLAAVELWFRAPSVGFGEPLVGIAQLAAESVASSVGHGEPLAALVQDSGGRLQITAFTDSVQVSAVVPAASAARIARAAFDDYTRPALTQDGFKRARESVAVEAAEAQSDPDVQLRAKLFASLFAQGPDRYTTLPTVKLLGALNYEEIVAFAKRAFRAENAVAVVTGIGESESIVSALGGVGTGEPAETPAESARASAPLSTAGDSAAGPALGMAFTGPPITDQRAATAMDFLADYLLDSKSGTIAKALQGVAPAASVSGQFITLHNPGVLLVEVVGDASDATREAVEQALQRVQRPLDVQTFETARRAYVYHVLHDLQSAQAQADNLGWYAVEGSPSYAPFNGGEDGEYLALARALTPAFVAQVARTYLQAAPAIATLAPRPANQAHKDGAQ